MSIKLMVEVLDHYHGPDARKLWLLAWAETANEGTRTGWPGRELLSRRTGRSAVRTSNIATELVAEGVLKRDGGGNRGGASRFVLLPLGPVDNNLKGSARTNPKPQVKGSESPEKGSESDGKGSGSFPLPAETSSSNSSEPSVNQPSSRARPGAARLIRSAYPDATDDEIDIIAADRKNKGARSLPAVLAHEVRHGTLQLPCGRTLNGRHSSACLSGDSRTCRVDWCDCRCHIKAVAP